VLSFIASPVVGVHVSGLEDCTVGTRQRPTGGAEREQLSGGRSCPPDLGERWPSRLVATAAADCLSKREASARSELSFSLRRDPRPSVMSCCLKAHSRHENPARKGLRAGPRQIPGVCLANYRFNSLTDDDWIGIMHHVTCILDKVQR
jgi:hypothetical protein